MVLRSWGVGIVVGVSLVSQVGVSESFDEIRKKAEPQFLNLQHNYRVAMDDFDVWFETFVSTCLAQRLMFKVMRFQGRLPLIEVYAPWCQKPLSVSFEQIKPYFSRLDPGHIVKDQEAKTFSALTDLVSREHGRFHASPDQVPPAYGLMIDQIKCTLDPSLSELKQFYESWIREIIKRGSITSAELALKAAYDRLFDQRGIEVTSEVTWGVYELLGTMVR